MNNIDKKFYHIDGENIKKLIATGNASIRCMLIITHRGGSNFYMCYYSSQLVHEITKTGTTGSFILIENTKFEYTLSIPYWAIDCICSSAINFRIV